MQNSQQGKGTVRIEALIVGPLQTNCYVLIDAPTNEALIVDPGGEATRILRLVHDRGAQVRYVVNTHAHFDHTLANAEIVRATGAPLVIHPDELPILRSGGGATWFGLQMIESPEPDQLIHEGDTLQIGATRVEIWHTPGHSPGSISLYVPTADLIIDGDLLFAGGIGRTDLPGGDWDTLMRSIERVLALPDATQIYPGHGPPTTVATEKRENPWLR